MEETHVLGDAKTIRHIPHSAQDFTVVTICGELANLEIKEGVIHLPELDDPGQNKRMTTPSKVVQKPWMAL